MIGTILIIDDEADIRELLADIFEDEGYTVLKAAHSEQALAVLDQNKIDLIVLDIWLDNSDMDGMQILKHIKDQDQYKDLSILMISGHGNIEMAVNAMKIGAFDYIEKPFKVDHILLTVKRALEQKLLRDENNRLKTNNNSAHFMDGYDHYKSPAMVKIMKDMESACDSDARILISGAVGTGKIRYAKLLHEGSKRQGRDLTIINAHDFDIGTFEQIIKQNEKGSVVIKSVHLLDDKQQAFLLSVLNQDGMKARLISICDESIVKRVEEGFFSSALYDRLSVIRVHLPCLKDRMDDFDDLVKDCYNSIVRELGFASEVPFITQDYIQKLKQSDWPGNIRQLKLTIELKIYEYLNNKDQSGMHVTPDSLKQIGRIPTNIANDDQALNQSNFNEQAEVYTHLPLKQARDKFEYEYLSQIFDIYDGNIAKMASFIEMDRAALHRKLKLMAIVTDKKANHS